MARPQWRLLFQGGLGYTFDGMDAALVAFILPSATAVFSLSSVQTGLLGSSVLIGYLFGVLSVGILGDLIGRKRVMMYALAFTPGLRSSRRSPLLGGFCSGPGWWRASARAPRARSSLRSSRNSLPAVSVDAFIGSLAGFFSFGFVLAALLGYFIVPNVDAGWRWVQV